ncbi:MAG: mechanosensitive ion channel [Gammaproteobacteria bacterium]|jgi:small conductance mechanosensitive channel
MTARVFAGLLLLLGMTAVLAPSAAPAQDTAAEPAAAGTLSPEVAAELDARLERATTLQGRIRELNQGREDVDPRGARILDTRLDRAWEELVAEAHDFAAQVAKLEGEGIDTGRYRETAMEVVELVPGGARRSIERTRSRLEPADPETSATDQAAADAIANEGSRRIDAFFAALVRNADLAAEFGLDVAAERDRIREELAARAQALSINLELTTEDVARLRAAQSLKPDDAEIAAMLTVLDQRTDFIAGQLDRTVRLLERLDVEAPEYKKQIVAATGEVSTDIFDPEVAFGLLGDWLSGIGDWLLESGPGLFLKLLLFVIIILVFRILARVAQKVVTKALDASKMELSQLLRRMIISVTRGVVMVFGILVALSQMGISVGPLLAGLGVAGFVIGFALQDTLANFASGLMILLYRPFDVGDIVETGGVFGKVKEMSLVNTTVLTFDNQTLVVPNTKIWGDVIKNVTAQDVRRVDLVFGIGYADDIPKAEGILEDVLRKHNKVLPDPPPVVRLHELGDSSVNFIVRPWVKRDDYWDVYWDVTRQVKLRFDAEGVTIPFPQRDVHLHMQEGLALAAPAAAASLAPATAGAEDDTRPSAWDADSPDANAEPDDNNDT